MARRRRRTTALLACLGALVGLPLAWTMADPAQAVAEAAAAKVQDLTDMLGGRSPGARTQDELTKHARVASKARVHPKIAAPAGHPVSPELPSTAALVDLLQPPAAPVEVASTALPPSLITPPTLGGIVGSTPGDSITSGGGGGGGGGGGVTPSFPKTTPRDVVTPVSAVPEPGTWAMMLLGFGLVGWRVRRRRRSLTLA